MYHWCLNGLIRVYTHPSDTAIKQQQGTLCINTHTHTHTHTPITAIWCSILSSENTRSKAPVSYWQPANNNCRYPSIRLINNLASSYVWCIERKIIRKVLRRKTLTHAQLPLPIPLPLTNTRLLAPHRAQTLSPQQRQARARRCSPWWYLCVSKYTWCALHVFV